MKTYLVPIDFSHASTHAAEYAANLSQQTNVDHIVLLNAYYVSPIETMLPSPDMVQVMEDQVEEEAANRLKKLNELKKKLSKLVREGVTIATHVNRSHLVRAVVENVESRSADLVILGSKGNTSKSDTQIGSHVINISKASPAPVIVVPPTYNIEPIKKIVVACDLKKVKETVPLQSLKKILDHKKVDLVVLNIDREAKHASGDAQRLAEETELYNMLEPYHPQYAYVVYPDVIYGVLKYATENDAQLVIALPHKYSFLRSLIHDSVSQRLTDDASVPVLLLK